MPAAATLARLPGRTRAMPARIGPDGATPLTVAGHGPTAALGAEGLAIVAPGDDVVPRGEPVEVALL